MTQTDWSSLGKPTATIKLSPTVAQNTDGRLEVFTVGTDGTLWHIWQTIPDKLWSNWDPLTKPHIQTFSWYRAWGRMPMDALRPLPMVLMGRSGMPGR